MSDELSARPEIASVAAAADKCHDRVSRPGFPNNRQVTVANREMPSRHHPGLN
jgi:hypothetical protein